MSEITDERLAELKDAHQHKSPFHVGYANTIDILAMITELQERRASSPAAGRDEIIAAQSRAIGALLNWWEMADDGEDGIHYLNGDSDKYPGNGEVDLAKIIAIFRALKETPNGN